MNESGLDALVDRRTLGSHPKAIPARTDLRDVTTLANGRGTPARSHGDSQFAENLGRSRRPIRQP